MVGGIEAAQRVDLIPEEIQSQGEVLARWEDVDQRAAHRIFAVLGDRVGPLVTEGVELLNQCLALNPLIPNIQASWVKMGPAGVRACLNAGVNDLGGTLMNESISRAAGASHGQEMTADMMEALIRSAGRTPRQRTTLYGLVSREPYLHAAAAQGLTESAKALI